MPRKRLDSPRAPPPSSILEDRERRSGHHHAIYRAKVGIVKGFNANEARALRAVFSSYDNWPDLSETERDEWRGYFDRMLERLQLLGYAGGYDAVPGAGAWESRSPQAQSNCVKSLNRFEASARLSALRSESMVVQNRWAE